MPSASTRNDPAFFEDEKLKKVGVEQCSVLLSFLSKILFLSALCFSLN